MRMLLNISFPHEPFNTLTKEGRVGDIMGKILDEAKPEAVYFTEQNGTRGCFMAVDVADPSRVPHLAEPWFLSFNANVEFRIAMTPDELGKAGLAELGKKWK